ncbi:MAG: hypothetical protein IT275_07125 [Chitinophagales bacterium]|nr:hypothetical protein [Chitinophagales bacterium]
MFDSKNIGIYNSDGTVIVESKKEITTLGAKNSSNQESEWNAPCKCWTSYWEQKNPSCVDSPGNQCFVFNRECCG